FTEDCVYVEHFYGTMRGRETVRAWIKPIMAKYGEIYTAYEWHVIDAAQGRVVFYMQNRRDHPGGQGTIDFPGISILEYAGGGQGEPHPGEHHHDAAHGREGAVLAPRDDDARDLVVEGAPPVGAVLLVERVHALDHALHEARAAAPPDRGREDDDVGGPEGGDELRPVVVL